MPHPPMRCAACTDTNKGGVAEKAVGVLFGWVKDGKLSGLPKQATSWTLLAPFGEDLRPVGAKNLSGRAASTF